MTIPFEQRVSEMYVVRDTIVDNAPLYFDTLDALLPEIPSDRIPGYLLLLADEGWINWWQKSGRIEPTLKAVS